MKGLDSHPADARESVTIVIPTLNEEGSIGAVIDEIMTCGYRNIIVVDGYSRDRTAEIARSKGANVILQEGSGKRDALRTGFRLAKTPYLVVIDGDSTYDAHDIELLLLHAGENDQVVGARKFTTTNMSRLHRIGNRIITFSFDVFFATKLRDVCSGMYLIKTQIAKGLEFNAGRFTVEEEILAQTVMEGNVVDVPINYRRRFAQKSHVSTWRQGFLDLVTLLNLAWRYNAAALFSVISGLAIIPAMIMLLWVFIEALLNRTFHQGFALIGVMLVVLATQGLAVTTLSVQVRRLERKLRR